MAWLAGYTYRKLTPITGEAGAGTDYQVRLEVHSGSGSDGDGVVYLSGHCQDFPNDVRFTDNDGDTELDHWLQEWEDDTAIFWIEIQDDLDGNQNFYIYYGKVSAASASDAADTFLLGVDFDDGLTAGLTINLAGAGSATVENPTRLHGVLRPDYVEKNPSNPVIPRGVPSILSQVATNNTWGLCAAYSLRIGERFNGFPAGPISSVQFKLQKVGNPTGTLSVTVRDVATDSLLGTLGTKDVATIAGALTFYTFNANVVNNPSLQDIRIQAEYSGGDGANYVGVGLQAADVYADGVLTNYIVAPADTATDDLCWQSLTYGQGVWDSTNLRDLALVLDANNRLYVNGNGEIEAYYQAYNGSVYRICRATSDDGGRTWVKYWGNPVTDWASGSVAVMYLPGAGPDAAKPYKMIMGAMSDFNLYESVDGISWVAYVGNPVLTLAAFGGTVPCLIKSSSGKYILVFESLDGSSQWIIRGATSTNLTSWTAMDSENSIFPYGAGGTWDDWGVANPKILELPSPNQGKFILAYNGQESSGAAWKVGFATTTTAPENWDTAVWTKYGNNPVMSPTGIVDDEQRYNTECAAMAVNDVDSTYFRFWFQGFKLVGSASISLALMPQGRILHAKSLDVPDGWIIGKNLSGIDEFAFELLVDDSFRDAAGAVTENSICGLFDHATVPTPDTNVNINPMARLYAGRRPLINGQADSSKWYVLYVDGGGTPHFWDGDSWEAAPTLFGTRGAYKLRIIDDGVNYELDIVNAITDVSIFATPPSIAKSSVKSFTDGRAIIASEPYTSHYYFGAHFDNWIIRKYVSPEPVVGTAGAEEEVAPPSPKAPAYGLDPMVF